MARILRSYLPLVVLLLVFTWSAATIATRRAAQIPADTKVIRIGHWQLEGGVREALDVLGREFADLPEIKSRYGKVRIVQEAIPEGTYGQWVSCQMIVQNAPDLLEVGYGLSAPIWLAYQNRYFVPLNDLAERPNPFNAGTDMEGRILRDTFTDGMRSGYQEELQAYMRVPLSRFTTRVFYNKTLLRKLTGRDEPPGEYRQFLQVCREIASQRAADGFAYTPIAGSGYHSGSWFSGMAEPLTYTNLFDCDFNRDGTVGTDEVFAAFSAGRVSSQSPGIRARFELTQKLIEQFQPGYTGLGRDEAVFLFAQQRAVFISSGTWDVGSLIDQAAGKFEVGVMAFPRPAGDDPQYGSLMLGPVYDPAGQGFPFGLTRFSKHPELARDFLLYLASSNGNRRLNEIVGWIPNVKNVPLPKPLARFAPVNQGMYASLNFELGGETVVRWMQDFSLFQTDPRFTIDDLFADFEPFYKRRGLLDWQEQQRDWRRGILNNERFLAGIRGEALLLEATDAQAPAWVRYRTYTASRQVAPEIEHARQVRLVTEGPDRPVGPYEYLPGAMRQIRERQAAMSQTSKTEQQATP